MADITDIIEYYVNLLIVQYAGPNQPKAQATIALLAQELLASGVILDVQNAYNLTGDSPAVGPQLDVLGKYAGVDRFYSELELTNYFGMITCLEVGSPPTSPPVFGLCLAANFNNPSYNGTLACDDIITVNNALTDASFLTLILFAIAVNNSNFSVQSISAILYEFFGTTVRREQGENFSVVYFISAAASNIIQAIIAKNLLPAPMGVGLLIVSNFTIPIFGFTSCSDIAASYESPYSHGLSTCANYATLSGTTLACSQIASVEN